MKQFYKHSQTNYLAKIITKMLPCRACVVCVSEGEQEHASISSTSHMEVAEV